MGRLRVGRKRERERDEHEKGENGKVGILRQNYHGALGWANDSAVFQFQFGFCFLFHVTYISEFVLVHVILILTSSKLRIIDQIDLWFRLRSGLVS